MTNLYYILIYYAAKVSYIDECRKCASYCDIIKLNPKDAKTPIIIYDPKFYYWAIEFIVVD